MVVQVVPEGVQEDRPLLGGVLHELASGAADEELHLRFEILFYSFENIFVGSPIYLSPVPPLS